MKTSHAHSLYSPALRYFVAVADYGSIREAARQLNIASSAVNRQILGLEEEFGVQLFERVGKRLRLSEAGAHLLRHAKSSLADFEVAVAQIDDLKGLRQGVVRVAAVESVADAILPELTYSFQQEYPGISVEVAIMSSLQVAQAIAQAEAHIGFTFNPPEQESLRVLASWDLKVGAIVAPGHPLAKQETCTFEDCLDYPLALPAESLSLSSIMAVPMARLKRRPDAYIPTSYIRANSLRFMRSIVRNGQHVAFQTILGIEKDRSAGLLDFVELSDPDLPRDRLVILDNATHELSMAPSVFVEHAQKALVDYLRDD